MRVDTIRRPLDGKVALVAGATRGAGRGIACELGAAGAIVYCSGRSTREHGSSPGIFERRPETIDETAEMVTARGGQGVPVRTDHLDARQVAALVARIGREHGRLDVLVNDISEGGMHDFTPFWKVDLARGFALFQNAVHTHLITAQQAAPLLIGTAGSLLVEVSDGWTLDYHGTLFYDVIKTTVNRLAYVFAEDLHPHGVTAVAVTPGYLRSEVVLDHHRVSEQNWQEAVAKDPLFAESETPFYIGRAIASLAADPRKMTVTGRLLSSWALAERYGLTDVDGRRPKLERRWTELWGSDGPLGPPKTGARWTIVDV